MKKRFLSRLKFFVTFVLFFSTSLAWLSAQEWRYLPEEEGYKKSAEALKNADYIFEGYCTPEGMFFYNDDSSEVFVSIRLVVTHSYKGNLSSGTIELVRPHTGEQHTTGFGLNRHYVFICQKSTLPMNPNRPEFDNNQAIQLLNEYTPNFHFNYKPDSIVYAVAGLYGRKFRTKDDFYKFLTQSSDNIVLPPKDDGDKKNVPLPKDNLSPTQKPDTTGGGGNYRLGEVNETIRYSVRNQRVYSANGKNYYAFDIYGQVFTSGLKLYVAFIQLSFNKATFGLNPVPSYRWVGTAGPIVPQGVVAVSGSNTPNDTTIQISIGPTSASLPNDTFRLVTIHLEVGLDTVCCQWSGLAFQPNNMTNGSVYYITTPAAGMNFNIETLPIQNYKLCTQPITITSVSPLLVHAGNGEFLEIKGKGFGTTKGEVLFKNADWGGLPNNVDNGFLNGLDSIWIESWADTLVKVKVPSMVTRGYAIGTNYCAGSGPIILRQSPCGDTLRSTQKVNIEYSFINYANQNQQPYIIDKFYIPRRYCINGFVFTFDTSVQNNSNGYLMIQVINEAMIRWSNYLGITLTYEKNAAGTAPFFTNNRNDPERNVIYLTGSTQGMSYSPVRVSTDSTDGIKKYYKDKMNIKINPSAYWNYSYSGDLTVNQQDFFWAILHELGHALGLDHDIDLVNDFKNMMHYIILPSLISADRANMNQWSDRAKKGAQDIVAQSKLKTWNPPVLATLSNINSAIVPAPSINPGGTVYICCGQESRTLTASHPTETTGWLWQPGSQTTQSITTNMCGQYRVRIAPTNCAKASLPSAPTVITLGNCPLDPTGNGEERMSVQPNPANFEAQVHYETSTLAGNHRILVISGTGSVVENILISELSGDITLYTGSWSPGTYWITFRNDTEIIDTDELVIIH